MPPGAVVAFRVILAPDINVITYLLTYLLTYGSLICNRICIGKDVGDQKWNGGIRLGLERHTGITTIFSIKLRI